MTQINNISGNNGINNISGSSSGYGDLELEFAKLQMDLAKTNKDSAMDKINEIKKSQNLQKKYVEAINDLRNAINGLKDDDKCDADKIKDMQNIIDICKDMGIDPPINADKFNDLVNAANNLQAAIDQAGGGNIDVANIPGIDDVRKACKDYNVDVQTKHYPDYKDISTRDLLGVNGAGWRTVSTADVQEIKDNIMSTIKGQFSEATVAQIKTLISQMESTKDTIGSDIQQQMVLIQDEMGKSSAYTQGSISAISKHSDTLTSVARG